METCSRWCGKLGTKERCAIPGWAWHGGPLCSTARAGAPQGSPGAHLGPSHGWCPGPESPLPPAQPPPLHLLSHLFSAVSHPDWEPLVLTPSQALTQLGCKSWGLASKYSWPWPALAQPRSSLPVSCLRPRRSPGSLTYTVKDLAPLGSAHTVQPPGTLKYKCLVRFE